MPNTAQAAEILETIEAQMKQPMNAGPSSSFDRHVYAVQRYVEFTSSRYAALMTPGVVTHPICCFGKTESAEVVTVGLNPSIGEFEKSRWPKALKHSALAERCANYFAKDGRSSSHPWFAPWTKALGHIGYDFENGSAVHLDLSPRATRYVSALKEAYEQALFLELVERDLWVLFATLDLCQNAKLVLIAGTVTGKFYINEFLQRLAPDYGWSLDGAFDRAKHPGKGKTQRHCLSNHHRRLPVFFCSSSPSDSRNLELLPQRVQENEEALKQAVRSPVKWMQ